MTWDTPGMLANNESRDEVTAASVEPSLFMHEIEKDRGRLILAPRRQSRLLASNFPKVPLDDPASHLSLCKPNSTLPEAVEVGRGRRGGWHGAA